MSKSTWIAIPMLLLSVATTVRAGEACMARSGARVMPLVELYTSEGCSSCPPADRWLSKEIRQQGQANFLAFHVDYWDAIGWPDRFATAQYSRRQQARVAAAGQRTVYTPQVMIGSTVQAPWRSPGAWRTSVGNARKQSAVALTMRMHPTATGWQASIGAAPIGSRAGAGQLWVARYVDGQTSDVRAGENRGVRLHHDRVVRQLSGPWPLPASGALSRQVALPAETAPWGITAFVQDSRGDILQSLSLHAGQCALDDVH